MTWAFLVISIVALAISRALNVYPVAAVVNCLRPREVHIPLSHQHMLWFSGLRGAIAFALSLSAATDLQGEPSTIAFRCRQAHASLSTLHPRLPSCPPLPSTAHAWLFCSLSISLRQQRYYQCSLQPAGHQLYATVVIISAAGLHAALLPLPWRKFLVCKCLWTGYGLALPQLPAFAEPGRVMLTTTFFLILFTVLFNGGLAGLLLGRMGLLGGPQGGVFSTRRYAAMQEVSLENGMSTTLAPCHSYILLASVLVSTCFSVAVTLRPFPFASLSCFLCNVSCKEDPIALPFCSTNPCPSIFCLSLSILLHEVHGTLRFALDVS